MVQKPLHVQKVSLSHVFEIGPKTQKQFALSFAVPERQKPFETFFLFKIMIAQHMIVLECQS
jgi:hypothetical protein